MLDRLLRDIMEKINMEVQKLNWSCSKESPEYLQVSLAAAMTLGFSANTFTAMPFHAA